MVTEMAIRKVNNGWTMEVWFDNGADHEVFIADSRNDLKNLIDRQLDINPNKELKVA
jgi:ribosomal protein L19E